MSTAIQYIQDTITYNVPSIATKKYFRQKLNALGNNPTTEQILPLWKEIVSNTPLAGRIARQFGYDDPSFLTEVTPAGSDSLTKLTFSDNTLNLYADVGGLISVRSLAEAIGNISSTFDTWNLTLYPNNLVQVIGNVADINLTGGLGGVNVFSLSSVIGGSKITSNSSATITSVIGDTSLVTLNGTDTEQSISEIIGQNVTLNANIANKTNIITAVNDAAMQAKTRPVFLTSFCSDHIIPTNNLTLANQVLAVMRVILNSSVTIGDADDITDCILGAAMIANGSPEALTVTVNACPGFDSISGTCEPINDTTTYTSKADCITGTQNYFASLKTGNSNIFTNAITQATISDALAGEVCAQYDS